MQKKIMIIGGGKWQVPIIQKAKDLSYFVINSNLYENSDGFKHADISLVANVLDKDKNLEIAKQYNIDAVITDQSDIAVNTVAFVAEQMNLMGVSTNTAELFTNKYRMRTELKVEGLHHPKFRLCTSLKEAEDFFSEMSATVILKPTDNQSSRGVIRVNSFNKLEESILETLEHSKNGSFLIEEYIDGIELTVEGFKPLGRNHETLAMSKKSHFDDLCVADSLLYLNDFKEFDIKILRAINDNLFGQLKFGITHVEYKYFNEKFYLVEAAIRGGGTKISSHIIPAVSGVDVNELLLLTVLNGQTPQFEKVKNKCAVLKFFNFSEGKVQRISGLEIHNNPNILDLELEFSVGDTILSPKDDRSRVGYYIAIEQSKEKLFELMQSIEDTVRVEYE